jgi:long-chain acyl-CoA synthetase
MADTENREHRDLTARAVARMAKHEELALADIGLSLPQFRVLILLSEGSAVASALARRLAVSPPSVTAIVDGLVARGLVERRADAEDRRRVDHALTDAGHQALVEADTSTATRLRDIAEYLEPGERDAALEALGVWHKALDRYLAAAIARRQAEREATQESAERKR